MIAILGVLFCFSKKLQKKCLETHFIKIHFNQVKIGALSVLLITPPKGQPILSNTNSISPKLKEYPFLPNSNSIWSRRFSIGKHGYG